MIPTALAMADNDPLDSLAQAMRRHLEDRMVQQVLADGQLAQTAKMLELKRGCRRGTNS